MGRGQGSNFLASRGQLPKDKKKKKKKTLLTLISFFLLFGWSPSFVTSSSYNTLVHIGVLHLCKEIIIIIIIIVIIKKREAPSIRM
jgi:hypothetical protein